MSSTISLASNCNYFISSPATANEALPTITGNITIVGGSGTTIERDPLAGPFRIFYVQAGAILNLQNLAIKNGSTPGLGGAVLNEGVIDIKNVKFKNNVADNGGAIANNSTDGANIVDCEFFENKATLIGGGGVINFGQLNVEKSRFSGNTAAVNGGAINIQPSAVGVVKTSSFIFNSSVGGGGALAILGSFTISQSQVQFNTGSFGGGIGAVTIPNLSQTAVLNNTPDNCSPSNIPGC